MITHLLFHVTKDALDALENLLRRADFRRLSNVPLSPSTVNRDKVPSAFVPLFVLDANAVAITHIPSSDP